MAKFFAGKEGRNPLIVIVGPTASGKSELGVRLAKRFNGEVISADSRQVYKGLDIGSGKITKKEMMGIPHHLLDVASPKRTFTVVQYQKRTFQAIALVLRRNKIPILVGGTPFYIYSVIDGYNFPMAKPNPKLRKQLEKLSVPQLFSKLQKLDPQRATSIEKDNPRRLVRALEIVLSTKKPVPQLKRAPLPYPVLFLGIKRKPEELKRRISSRLKKRLRHGMGAEVKNLHASGVSWKRLGEFGLEYRYVAQYLQKNISKQEMIDSIQKESEDLARRQMTWFKKDPRIHWIQAQKEAENLLRSFLAESR